MQDAYQDQNEIAGFFLFLRILVYLRHWLLAEISGGEDSGGIKVLTFSNYFVI